MVTLVPHADRPVRGRHGNGSATYAISGPFVASALEVIATGGRYVLFGVSAGRDVSLNWQNVYRRGLSVLGFSALVLDVAERRRRLAATLTAMADGRMRIPVAHTVPLAAGADVFALPPVPARGETVLVV